MKVRVRIVYLGQAGWGLAKERVEQEIKVAL